MGAFGAIVVRDLKLSFRRWSELANPLIFFVIVAALFPLAIAPGEVEQRTIGIGVLWVAALLSSLLALEGLFRNDADDGSLEQLLLSPVPFGVTVIAKIAAHWLVTGVPLIVLAPLVALAFGVPVGALPVLLAALLLATPTLSVLSAAGAALTLGIRHSGAIIGLLVLPLATPLLIFGARATDLAAHGEATAGPLYLLAALAVLAVSAGPVAVAGALRVGLE
ncbi:MAG TPA: heme exporter protein CcmB [Gammaproteobacteria bacterium]